MPKATFYSVAHGRKVQADVKSKKKLRNGAYLLRGNYNGYKVTTIVSARKGRNL
jgi:hypothetical protein